MGRPEDGWRSTRTSESRSPAQRPVTRLLGRDEDAAQAYRHLLEGDGATPEDLGEMTYFYDPYPIDAGRVLVGAVRTL